jgi:hypothetical protein
MRSYNQLASDARRFLKPLAWKLRPGDEPSKLGFILGSQRSGTNMLNDAFDRDWNCMAFGEDGGLALGPCYEHDLRWRWRPFDQVRQVFESLRAPLIIAKPIVESQRALELLSYFPGSKIIWAYRDYRGVAQSSIALFGAESSLHNLRAVLDPGKHAHWFSQNLPDESRELVRRFFDPGRPLADLKVLGWLVRNSLYFQLQLDRNARVAISRYENLVRHPVVEMTRLYKFLGAQFPGPQVCRHMHRDSLKKGSHAEVSGDLEKLCSDLLERLDEARSRTEAWAIK